MSAESNKALASRYFDELLNQGRLNVAEEILTPEIVLCDPLVTIHGIDRLQRFLLMVRRLFQTSAIRPNRASPKATGLSTVSRATALSSEMVMASESFKVLRPAVRRSQ
jgi:hypothetical protein